VWGFRLYGARKPIDPDHDRLPIGEQLLRRAESWVISLRQNRNDAQDFPRHIECVFGTITFQPTTLETSIMKVTVSIQRGAQYLCVKFGEVVTAIEQVAVVKGLPMWEVERHSVSGIKRRLIVSARTLLPVPPLPAGA
jgi:hypothetical protein